MAKNTRRIGNKQENDLAAELTRAGYAIMLCSRQSRTEIDIVAIPQDEYSLRKFKHNMSGLIEWPRGCIATPMDILCIQVRSGKPYGAIKMVESIYTEVENVVLCVAVRLKDKRWKLYELKRGGKLDATQV